jgi:small nuclear ribonucleoprotein (snRNP)-like protein
MERGKQLPIGILEAARGSCVNLELRNGEELLGFVVDVDRYMNFLFRDVVKRVEVSFSFSSLSLPFLSSSHSIL